MATPAVEFRPTICIIIQSKKEDGDTLKLLGAENPGVGVVVDRRASVSKSAIELA